MTDLLRCTLPDPLPELEERLAMPRIRGSAVEALAAGRGNPRAAGGAIARWFRKDRRLGSKERPLAQELVYGAIRWEHLLIRAGARDDQGLIDGAARLLCGDRLEGLEALSPAEDYSSALSLDYRLAREWIEVLGPEEAAALGATLSRRADTVLRANRLRCTREELSERLAAEGVSTTRVDAAPDALALTERANVQGLASFKEGWFEVQDTSSQLLVEAMEIEPGTRVVDLCAGAGGKSLALAAKGAVVTAYDVREDALKELDKRARRAGAAIAIAEPEPAPVVLVDAPCSGTGRLRRDPALRWGLEVGAHLPLQRALLEEARALTEPGGRLVYATCSLVEAENSHLVEGALLEDRVTLWPHKSGTDGFSWSIWRRDDGS